MQTDSIAHPGEEAQPCAQEAATGEYTREEYEAGCQGASDLAFTRLAQAWVDRWEALGGSFGVLYSPTGEPERLARGMVLDLDLWTPIDDERDDLPPHVKMLEDRHHDGAVRILEGMLELCPELRSAVKAIGTEKAWPRYHLAGRK